MSRKSLFQFNAFVNCVIGVIHLLFSGKVSQLIFSSLDIHLQTGSLIGIIGVMHLSIGLLSLLVQTVKENSGMEKNLLLAFFVFWISSFISRAFFIGIGFKLIIPLNILIFVMSMIFFVHYIQSRRGSHS